MQTLVLFSLELSGAVGGATAPPQRMQINHTAHHTEQSESGYDRKSRSWRYVGYLLWEQEHHTVPCGVLVLRASALHIRIVRPCVVGSPDWPLTARRVGVVGSRDRSQLPSVSVIVRHEEASGGYYADASADYEEAIGDYEEASGCCAAVAGCVGGARPARPRTGAPPRTRPAGTRA